MKQNAFLFTSFALLSAATSHAALTTAGDLAFIGMNSDGVNNFAVVTLADISPNTIVRFTDNEWNGSPLGAGGAFNTGESLLTWDSGALTIDAGTVIRFDALDAGQTALVDYGTISSYTGTKGLSASNEGIYAFLGLSSAPTAFLSAIANDGFSINAPVAGTGLTIGASALEFLGDIDLMAYNGSRNHQTTFSAYAAVINNPTNWVTQNTSGDDSADSTNPDVPFDNTAFTIPEPGSATLAGVGLALLTLRRRRL